MLGAVLGALLRGPALGYAGGHAREVYSGATRAHALWAITEAILKACFRGYFRSTL